MKVKSGAVIDLLVQYVGQKNAVWYYRLGVLRYALHAGPTRLDMPVCCFRPCLWGVAQTLTNAAHDHMLEDCLLWHVLHQVCVYLCRTVERRRAAHTSASMHMMTSSQLQFLLQTLPAEHLMRQAVQQVKSS